MGLEALCKGFIGFEVVKKGGLVFRVMDYGYKGGLWPLWRKRGLSHCDAGGAPSIGTI